MASPRVLKLADQIKVIVAEMLERRIKDPRLGLHHGDRCAAHGGQPGGDGVLHRLGTESDQAGTAVALASATGLIRSQVGKQLGMKFTPTIAFVLDAVPENARQIDDLLARAQAIDARVAEQAAHSDYAGEPDPYKHDDDDEQAG